MREVIRIVLSCIRHIFLQYKNSIVSKDFVEMIKSFTSLGPFVRQAAKTNPDQADLLFKKFGEEALKIMKKQPRTFLSTAGMGISWLHLRLDNRPKYYVSEYGYNN